MGIHRSAVALVFVAVAVAVATVGSSPAAAGDSDFYRPPVDAPVVDPFRAPTSPFGPGNRGLTYDLEPGTPVRAAAPGRVVFAGTVAGTLHVTVRHDDGLRTSYSFLDAIEVRRGATVSAGAIVGRAGAGFHFGVRDGDAYLDPASLFGTVEVRVRLVPHDEPPPATDPGLMRERIALTEVVREKGLVRRAVDWGIGQAERQVERHLGAVHTVIELDPTKIVHDGLRTIIDGFGEDCTTADVVAPASPAAGHVGILVAGYGSTSDAAAVDDVDTGSLGYAAGDVVRYSYAGGRVPDDGVAPTLQSLPSHAYEPSDTFEDLRAEGVALADLVEGVASARPGEPIDLVAHSQGGVVVRLALVELVRRGLLDTLGSVVTIGTPHRGVDLATGSLLLGPVGHRLLAPVEAITEGGVDPDAVSVGQMAETSSLMLELRRDGVPDGVDLRTIGAAGDLVVTGDKTTVSGHDSAMVGLFGPTAHDSLPGDPATTREIRLALAGLAPRCRSLGETLADAFVPQAISFGENALVGTVAASVPG